MMNKVITTLLLTVIAYFALSELLGLRVEAQEPTCNSQFVGVWYVEETTEQTKPYINEITIACSKDGSKTLVKVSHPCNRNLVCSRPWTVASNDDDDANAITFNLYMLHTNSFQAVSLALENGGMKVEHGLTGTTQEADFQRIEGLLVSPPQDVFISLSISKLDFEFDASVCSAPILFEGVANLGSGDEFVAYPIRLEGGQVWRPVSDWRVEKLVPAGTEAITATIKLNSYDEGCNENRDDLNPLTAKDTLELHIDLLTNEVSIVGHIQESNSWFIGQESTITFDSNSEPYTVATFEVQVID